jgi:hypothetical protein
MEIFDTGTRKKKCEQRQDGSHFPLSTSKALNTKGIFSFWHQPTNNKSIDGSI